jgi:hypothetical protein
MKYPIPAYSGLEDENETLTFVEGTPLGDVQKALSPEARRAGSVPGGGPLGGLDMTGPVENSTAPGLTGSLSQNA